MGGNMVFPIIYHREEWPALERPYLNITKVIDHGIEFHLSALYSWEKLI
jgi:hypothetical protein